MIVGKYTVIAGTLLSLDNIVAVTPFQANYTLVYYSNTVKPIFVRAGCSEVIDRLEERGLCLNQEIE